MKELFAGLAIGVGVAVLGICVFGLGWLSRGRHAISSDIVAEDILEADAGACLRLSSLVSVTHPELADTPMRDAAMRLSAARRFLEEHRPARFIKGGF